MRRPGRDVLFALIFTAIAVLGTSCERVAEAGVCVQLSADCVWCNASTPYGTYCINTTRTATTTPHACLPCTHHNTFQMCTASYSSLSGSPCVWCRDALLVGPYCTARQEKNSNCPPCTSRDQSCSIAIDNEGRACHPQCGDNVFQPVACTAAPSNCTSCSTITSYDLCVSIENCYWCRSQFTEGSYCNHDFDANQANPNCDCTANSAAECEAIQGPNEFTCAWCAPWNVTSGPYCVAGTTPSWSCRERCFRQTSSTDCLVAGSQVCGWCAPGGLRDGYFCTAANTVNPNCTMYCNLFTTPSACAGGGGGCVWCNAAQSHGDFCRSQQFLCPPCSTREQATECTSSLNPNLQAANCTWCAPLIQRGPYCLSTAVDAACPTCRAYDDPTQCGVAFDSNGPCVWCDPMQASGPYCVSTTMEPSDNVCPDCTAYTTVTSCQKFPCVWCNVSATVGAYCSPPNLTACTRPCWNYNSYFECFGSSDAASACVWCDGRTDSGSFCTSSVNGSCPSCNGYVHAEECIASSDSVGRCIWCSDSVSYGPYCTGAATPNSNCLCNSSSASNECAAAHTAAGAPCVWCQRLQTCFDDEASCSFSCETITNNVTCVDVHCTWCSNDAFSVCRNNSNSCPPCSTYPSSQCAEAWSPTLNAPSCFLCRPNDPATSQCASVVQHVDVDPSVCPPCSSYTTEAQCVNSLLTMDPQVACKWCAVSYSCVPDTQGCGDCFSFLVPGNRLKPYWLSFVTVVKDYLVLLLAVAIAPRLQHAWQRFATKRRLQSLHAGADDRHVVVYLAQDEIVDSNGDALGSLSAVLSTVAHARGHSSEEVLTQWLSDDVITLSTMDPMVTSTTLYDTRDDTSRMFSLNTIASGPADERACDDDSQVFGQSCTLYDIKVTFVTSKYLLQRAMYALIAPPSFIIIGLSVGFLIVFVTTTGVWTADAFEQRRREDPDLFGWNMFFIVLGYRIVNSGLQPTAALMLWQVLRSFATLCRRTATPDALPTARRLPSVKHTLEYRWGFWTRAAATAQVALFAPVWAVSLVGIASYVWVFVLPVILGFALAFVVKLLAQRASQADTPPSDDGPEAPLASDTVEANESSGRRYDFDSSVQRLPTLPTLRKVASALLIFLCERAIPVMVMSTALQTGYNYAALYVLAPGHMYSGYLDVVPLEYGARSNVCLLQDVENILGDAAASVTSYLMPFA